MKNFIGSAIAAAPIIAGLSSAAAAQQTHTSQQVHDLGPFNCEEYQKPANESWTNPNAPCVWDFYGQKFIPNPSPTAFGHIDLIKGTPNQQYGVTLTPDLVESQKPVDTSGESNGFSYYFPDTPEIPYRITGDSAPSFDSETGDTIQPYGGLTNFDQPSGGTLGNPSKF